MDYLKLNWRYGKIYHTELFWPRVITSSVRLSVSPHFLCTLKTRKSVFRKSFTAICFSFLQGFLFAAISRTSFTYSFHTSYTGAIWHKESTNRFSGHSQIHRHFISFFIMTYLCCILIYSVETFDICCIVCKVNTHGFWQGSRSQACFSFHRTSVMLWYYNLNIVLLMWLCLTVSVF